MALLQPHDKAKADGHDGKRKRLGELLLHHLVTWDLHSIQGRCIYLDFLCSVTLTLLPRC